MASVYEASTIRQQQRVRRTKAEIMSLRNAIYEIMEANRPCSSRQVYYMGIPRLWEKDTGPRRKNYMDVNRNLGVMRETGLLPWGWLTDSTRYVRIATMFDSADEALEKCAEFYRRDLWSRQPRRVEVWAESDSTASLVESVTRKLGVGLFSCRGQAGKEFVHASAQTYRHLGKPVTILYLGDWDPSGLAIPRSLEGRLNDYSDGEVSIEFRRLAVTAADVASGEFEMHAVNDEDRNIAKFKMACFEAGVSSKLAMEVEAIPPPLLRDRVESALYELVEDPGVWNATLAAEESEREILRRIVEREVLA